MGCDGCGIDFEEVQSSRVMLCHGGSLVAVLEGKEFVDADPTELSQVCGLVAVNVHNEGLLVEDVGWTFVATGRVQVEELGYFGQEGYM